MNRLLLFFLLCTLYCTSMSAQNPTVSSDKVWSKQSEVLKNAYEAEYIIRIGDIDNLGFEFPEGFDPFCGRLTDAHAYPWDAKSVDLPFMDRILVSSRFKAGANLSCDADGYSVATEQWTKGIARYTLPTDAIKGVEVKNAYLQLFLDDFQAPVFCSKFRITLNEKVFVEGEKILNSINQTGPVGKLVTLPLPQEFYESLNQGTPLRIGIDEINAAGDGYAIDFIRLLINRKRENSCKGNIRGIVLEKDTERPISAAKVSTSEGNLATADAEGRFEFKNLPTGYEAILASANGYADGRSMADIGEGEDNPEVIIYLEKGKARVQFDNKTIAVGEAIQLNNILFDQGKADLKPVSITELDKLVQFLQKNASVEIELSGHTSSEGEAAYNRTLSYRRVKACRDYIVSKGIDVGRLGVLGYGPDRPIAPNDTELNRAKNRRVEMRIMKL